MCSVHLPNYDKPQNCEKGPQHYTWISKWPSAHVCRTFDFWRRVLWVFTLRGAGLQSETLSFPISPYQIWPACLLITPVCIVNRLLTDVQRRITCFGEAGGNYSYTMTCSSEIKVPFEALGIESWVLFLFVHRRSVKVTNWKIVSLAFVNGKRPSR